MPYKATDNHLITLMSLQESLPPVNYEIFTKFMFVGEVGLRVYAMALQVYWGGGGRPAHLGLCSRP